MFSYNFSQIHRQNAADHIQNIQLEITVDNGGDSVGDCTEMVQ